MSTADFISITISIISLSAIIFIAIKSAKKADVTELQTIREHNAIEIAKLQTHIEWIQKFVPKEARNDL